MRNETLSIRRIVTTGVALAGLALMVGCSAGAPDLAKCAPRALPHHRSAELICADGGPEIVRSETRDAMNYTVPGATNLQVVESAYNRELVRADQFQEYLTCVNGQVERSPKAGTW